MLLHHYPILRAHAHINTRERPLALYVFSESKHVLADVTERVSAGGVTHNDTLLHFTGMYFNLYTCRLHCMTLDFEEIIRCTVL